MLILEEIIKTHDEIIKRYGGEFGLLNIGNLEFMVDFVNNEDKDILWKAALILKCMVCGHPFLDGNKRTALEVTETYLYMYGYIVTADAKEKVNFILTLAKEDLEITTIESWLKKNTKRL